MPAKRENCVGEFVRRKYPDLAIDNFQAYNNIVSKLRSRAKARGFNPSDLTQEQFDIINNDNLPDLEKGEKFHLDWEHSSMCKGMIEDAVEYLTRKLVRMHVEETEDLSDWLVVPSTVKLAARGIKYGNDYLLSASHLSPQQIDLVKAKLLQKGTNFSEYKTVEDIL